MQLVAALAGHDLSVVSGSDEFRVDPVGILEQPTEFNPLIAPHTGIWCATAQVIVDKVIDDAAEILLQIQGVEGDAHFCRYPAGIGSIRSGTAALFMIGPALSHPPEHRQG